MDKREAILERLLALLQGIPAQAGYDTYSVFRNRTLLKEDKRPAIALLDAGELSDTLLEARGRMFFTPQVMTMLPQIFVLLKERTTPSNDGVGEELNVFRVAIIKAIAEDRALQQLCGPDGMVSLRRVTTDLQNGALLQGQMEMDFALTYVLNPGKLSASVT